MTKTEYAEYLGTAEWRELADQCKRRAGNKCERCELPRWLSELVYDQDLHAHHKNYRSKGSATVQDLESLCARCHELETFKRSELRAPKSATCSLCGRKHWNYRSELCSCCRDVFSEDGAYYYDADGPVDGTAALFMGQRLAELACTYTWASPLSLQFLMKEMVMSYLVNASPVREDQIKKFYDDFETLLAIWGLPDDCGKDDEMVKNLKYPEL